MRYIWALESILSSQNSSRDMWKSLTEQFILSFFVFRAFRLVWVSQATSMLETVYVGDVLCWWQFRHIGDRTREDTSHQHKDTITKILKLSPSQSHQHNVVTNIAGAGYFLSFILQNKPQIISFIIFKPTGIVFVFVDLFWVNGNDAWYILD